MKFDKEKFKESMSTFKYGKEGIKDDLLYVIGKISMNRDTDFIDLWDGDFESNLKQVLGDELYKADGQYVYLMKDISLLSILAIPFKLFPIIVMRIVALFVMLIATPLVAANSIVLNK